MNERIAYIDYSKAVAIILVVTGHIIFFNIFSQDAEKADMLLIEQILKSVQMPLFIFCSGLVMKNSDITLRETLLDIYKRFRLLIVPFIVIGISFALISDKTPADFLSKGMKLGYWYLLTLFELCLLHNIYLHISKIWKSRRTSMLFDLLLGGVIYVIIYKIYSGKEAEEICWQNTLSWLQLVRYYPYYFLAVIIRKYNILDIIVSNKWIYCISLCTCIVVLYANEHNIHIFGRSFILPVFLLITIIHMMKLVAQSDLVMIKRLLNYVGKKTLDIYLFHYFVLASFPMPCIADLLENNNGLVFSLILIIPFVMMTIAFSLALGKIFRSSKIINDLIFFR